MRKFEERFPGMGIEGRLIWGRVGVNGTVGQVEHFVFRGRNPFLTNDQMEDLKLRKRDDRF